MEAEPFHGKLGHPEWALPSKIVHCEAEARPVGGGFKFLLISVPDSF